jgi:hypothetical protein
MLGGWLRLSCRLWGRRGSRGSGVAGFGTLYATRSLGLAGYKGCNQKPRSSLIEEEALRVQRACRES